MNFDKYWSPNHEVSLFKGIPMEMYTPEICAKIRKIVGPFRVKFRGPRPASSRRDILNRRAGCLKEDAITFTVYKR